MGERAVNDLKLELSRIIAAEGNGVYWWILFDARIVFFVKGNLMNIKMPLPKLLNNPKYSNSKYKKHDEESIAHARGIWIELIRVLKEKLDKVNSGELSVEEAFKDGILFENNTYGLKYKEGWSWENEKDRRT